MMERKIDAVLPARVALSCKANASIRTAPFLKCGLLVCSPSLGVYFCFMFHIPSVLSGLGFVISICWPNVTVIV